MNVRALFFLFASFWLGGASQAGAVDWNQGTPLTPPSPPLGKGDRFGATVAIGNDVIAVGAYLADRNGIDSGVIFFYNKIGKLLSELSGEPGDQLGFDLAFDSTGTTLLAGAPFARKNGVRCGAVRIITFSTTEAKSDEPINNPDCKEGSEFGSAVAVDKKIMAVGARGSDRRRGRIYASFNFDGKKIPDLQPLPADVQVGDELGTSLATDGSWLVAGAPFADAQDIKDSGAVYAFRRVEGSVQSFQVLSKTGQPSVAFGYSVALHVNDRSNLAVGAPLEDGPGNTPDSGAVHRFKASQEGDWAVDGLPTFGDSKGDQLGASVSWGASGLYASASRNKGRGAVFPINIGNGELGNSISSPTPLPGAEFGYAVATRGSLLVAGAYREEVRMGVDSGAAYVFEPKKEDAEQTVYPEFESLQTCVFEAETVTITVKVKTSDSKPPATKVTVGLQTCPDRKKCVAKSPSDFDALDENREVDDAGGSGTEFKLTVKSDSVLEAPEKFVVRASIGNQYKDGEVTIHDFPFVLSAGPLNTSEAGGSSRFAVSLACSPKEDVRVFVRSTDPSEGSVAPAVRRFMALKEEDPKKVDVTGVDDSICDGPQPYNVEVSTASRDLRFDGLLQTIPAVNADNDPAMLTKTQGVCTFVDNTVLYTVKVSNVCLYSQTASFEDPLPPEVSVVTASADSGTATVDYLTNSVVWSGSVPAAGDAVITIVGGLNPVAPGTEVANPALDAPPPLPFERVVFDAGEVGCFPPPP